MKTLRASIEEAYIETGWTTAQLSEEVSQYGTLDDDRVRVFFQGANAYETTISLLMLALKLEVYSLDGLCVHSPIPTFTEKRKIRQAHAMPDPANRIVFTAIWNAWKQIFGTERGSKKKLHLECQKHGHINYSTIYNFCDGQQNVRENQLDLLMKALRLSVRKR